LTTFVLVWLRYIVGQEWWLFEPELRALKAGCLTLYEAENAQGTELPAIIGVLQERIELEEERLIPKFGNLDSYYPMLCGNDRIVNVNQIKRLDGHHQPAVAPQMGRE
jgi:hypothetical protein